jgi:hypothetical protein
MNAIEETRSGAGGDPLLEPLRRAGDHAREREIERLAMTVAQPLTARIVSRFLRSNRILHQQDADDVGSTVMLRLVSKLTALSQSPEDTIDDFQNYVATLTYNTIYDFVRDRFPQHTRLKNKLRYVLTHDPRLALWSTASGLACGLREWRDRQMVDERADLLHATPAMRDARRPAEAVMAIVHSLRRPLTLDALAELTGELWGIRDAPAARPIALEDPSQPPSQLMVAERREFLRSLWHEIQLLRPLQRQALLLNLRDGDTINVLSLFLVTETATFGEVAAAIAMSPEALKAIWNQLPLDDARIARNMTLTRQQVINLRKSARERLARRLLTQKESAE